MTATVFDEKRFQPLASGGQFDGQSRSARFRFFNLAARREALRVKPARPVEMESGFSEPGLAQVSL